MAPTAGNDKRKILSKTQESAVSVAASITARSSGAVAGAAVGGPVGAVVGAAIAGAAAPMMVRAANTMSSSSQAVSKKATELKVKHPEVSTSSIMSADYKSPAPRLK